MHDQTKATAISRKDRAIIHERDGRQCINCRRPDRIELAHYIRRSQGGLGIPENVVSLCKKCHEAYDSAKTKVLKEYHQSRIKRHLDKHYPGFSDEDRVYKNKNEPW